MKNWLLLLPLLLLLPPAAAVLQQQHENYQRGDNGRHHQRYHVHKYMKAAGPSEVLPDLQVEPSDPVKPMNEELQKKPARHGVRLDVVVAAAEAKIRADELKIRRIREQQAAIHEAHDKAVRRLNEQLLPQVALSQRRLEKRRLAVAKHKEEWQTWDRARGDRKAVAQSTLQEEKLLSKMYKEAHEAAEMAEQAEQYAKRKYELIKARASHDVSQFQLAEDKWKAAKAATFHEVEEADTLEASMRSGQAVMEAEQLQLEKALVVKDSKLESSVNAIEEEKERDEQAYYAAKDRLLATKARQEEKIWEVREESQVADDAGAEVKTTGH